MKSRLSLDCFFGPHQHIKGENPIPVFARSTLFTLSLRSITKSQLSLDAGFSPSFHPPSIIPYHNHAYETNRFLQSIKLYEKTFTKLMHQKCVIFNKAINLHSRGPTEQYFYVWEPHCGCLHQVKKVCWYPCIREGQQSHKYGF